MAPVEAHVMDNIDCFIAIIVAPENTRDGSDIPHERMAMVQAAGRPHAEPFFREREAVGRMPVADARARAGRRE